LLSVTELLSEQGPLHACLPGFRVRPAQQAMAQAIADALHDKEDLLVEAGTGTGKTLAYLIPAIHSGLKVIISTGTKNLQDQLLHHDVPLLRKALNVPVTITVLKGRANYFCLQRFELARHEMQFDAKVIAVFNSLKTWSVKTRSGDIAEYSALPESDPLWGQVTSNVDNCLGQECQHYEACFLVNARREALAADIVIVNHYLLLADMALQESGFGELLPAADAYIIDEAHQLPDIASQYFGQGISTSQFVELANDATQFYHAEINENNELRILCAEVTAACQQARNQFGSELRRAAWASVNQDKKITESLQALTDAVTRLQQQLVGLAPRSRTLENCHERCELLRARLQQVTAPAEAGYVHWFEVHRRSISLHMTPLDVAGPFQEHKARKNGVWIFTSATLTVAKQFQYFTARLGLHSARCLRWDSPFDYQQQMLMFLPKTLPEPNTPAYLPAVLHLARQVLKHSQGRAFLLFTSHRALKEAATTLRGELPYPLLVQGDASRDNLLERFRTTPHSVLLGTSSFWEGVDVRGEALSCVIIDKLPFAPPDDPVLVARMDDMRRKGQNAFIDYQLPTAVITLTQGAGRLIRDFDDRGVLVICDPRLLTKPYGKTFLKSLPNARITHDIHDVASFFAVDTVLAGAGV